MLKNILFVLLLLTVWTSQAQHRCGFEPMHNWAKQHFPGLEAEIEAYQRAVPDLQRQGAMGARNVLTIPVVVHVIHSGESVGLGRNLSTARINQQIDRLNADFRRTNSDAVNTPSNFSAVDTEIEFCLASVDPNGQPTTGIERHSYPNIPNQNYIENTIKPQTYWNSNLYLNIWTVELTGGLLGYAYLPTPTMVGSDVDGLVLNYEYVGNNILVGAQGRTATHEIGHYLGLAHTWANFSNNGGCGNDDGISDTPLQDSEYYNCPGFAQFSCGSSDMYMNYMDYVQDNCMNAFTQGQANVMRAVLSTGTTVAGNVFGSRAALIGNAAVACSGGGSGAVCHDFLSQGDFSMGFETGESLTGWSYINSNGDSDGNSDPVTWRTSDENNTLFGASTGSRYVRYFWNQDGQTGADDWLFSNCFEVKDGHTYRLTLDYAASSFSGITYPEKMRVALHSDATTGSQVLLLRDLNNINNAYPNYQTLSQGFTANGDGTFRLALYAYSDPDQYVLQVDNINIEDLTATATEEVAKQGFSFQVFPNPARDFVNVALDFEEPQEEVFLQMTDVLGRLVQQRRLQNVQQEQLQWQLNDLEAGVYLLQLQTRAGQQTRKIVVE